MPDNKYIVVKAPNLQELEKMVSEKMADKYEPVGGVDKEGASFFQAMKRR